MATISVTSESKKDRLNLAINMCLQTLCELEDMTCYKEVAISNCINFLQDLEIVSMKDIANDILKDMGE